MTGGAEIAEPKARGSEVAIEQAWPKTLQNGAGDKMVDA
jgi:hypothetical protein